MLKLRWIKKPDNLRAFQDQGYLRRFWEPFWFQRGIVIRAYLSDTKRTKVLRLKSQRNNLTEASYPYDRWVGWVVASCKY